jgi:hypothetical protein
MTLGRVIVGGSMDFTKQLNGFADVGMGVGTIVLATALDLSVKVGNGRDTPSTKVTGRDCPPMAGICATRHM